MCPYRAFVRHLGVMFFSKTYIILFKICQHFVKKIFKNFDRMISLVTLSHSMSHWATVCDCVSHSASFRTLQTKITVKGGGGDSISKAFSVSVADRPKGNNSWSGNPGNSFDCIRHLVTAHLPLAELTAKFARSTISCATRVHLLLQMPFSLLQWERRISAPIPLPPFYLTNNMQWGRFINKKKSEKNKNRGERQKTQWKPSYFR
jgi:hypothetical protein